MRPFAQKRGIEVEMEEQARKLRIYDLEWREKEMRGKRGDRK